MSLKIGFCGPNLQLNEELSHLVKDSLYKDGIEFMELPHPLVKITEMTGWEPDKWDSHNIDWMNMWSASIRRMDLEKTRNIDVVVSASCGIDNVCLQATWLGEQVERQKVGPSLFGPGGEELIGDAGIWINRSGSVLQAILNSSEEEMIEVWDFVYAVLPVEVELTATMAPLMIQYRDFLASVPAYQQVIRLPDNVDAATDALKNEVSKWQKKLDS